MQKIIKILNFFKTVFMFTQYIPVKSFFYNFKTKKEHNVIFQRCIMNYCNYKLYRVSKDKINHSKNIIYFSNHRSWGDFFIDNVVTEYCSRFVSRIEVAFILPIYAYITAYLSNDSILFFRRGQTSILEFEKLIKINQINQSGNNILIYPEGTRRAGLDYACDLKKGLIYYSYKEKSPIQFIISKNKEKILNEKKFTSENNVDVFVHYSDVYYPDVEKYKSMQEYYDFINGEWKTTFNAIYETDYESKKSEYERMDITKIHDNNYPVDRALIYFIKLTVTSGLVAITSQLLPYITGFFNPSL